MWRHDYDVWMFEKSRIFWAIFGRKVSVTSHQWTSKSDHPLSLYSGHHNIILHFLTVLFSQAHLTEVSSLYSFSLHILSFTVYKMTAQALCKMTPLSQNLQLVFICLTMDSKIETTLINISLCNNHFCSALTGWVPLTTILYFGFCPEHT